MRERVILYSDLNNFFASVETALHPEYTGKPLIVCGDPEKRLGVVFAKNEEAKSYGIRTAETVYSALKKCPQVLRVPTHFSDYNRYSKAVREIYARYTDVIEPLSIDECAMDVTDSVRLFGGGEKIAEEIRAAVKNELGVTVSIGVSFNKIYAKLASELKKPDAVTVISRENYKAKVFPLPVSYLLYVGKSTEEALLKHGIHTIGELARADSALLVGLLGKRGEILKINADGRNDEPVKSESDEIKSIGNSMTLPYDVSDAEQIRRLFYMLAESVVSRLRESGEGKCDTVHITVKDEFLRETSRQKKYRLRRFAMTWRGRLTKFIRKTLPARKKCICSVFPFPASTGMWNNFLWILPARKRNTKRICGRRTPLPQSEKNTDMIKCRGEYCWKIRLF